MTSPGVYLNQDGASVRISGGVKGDTGPPGPQGVSGFAVVEPYPARASLGTGPVSYIGDTEPTDWLPGDTWINNSQVDPGVAVPLHFATTTAAYTTAALGSGSRESGLLSLPSCVSFRLYKLVLSAAARVRLYTTTAKRDADVLRTISTDPGPDAGVIFDFVGSDALLSACLSPTVDGWLPGTAGSVPITIDKIGGSAVAVTATLTYVRTE